jgi:hypothetical protein
MKTLTITILGILCVTFSKGQSIIDSTSMQAFYTNQVFYSLDNGEVSNVDNNNWAIAFSVGGTGAAGSSILLNEATSTLWAYPGEISQWNSFDTTNFNTWERLLNTDTSWTNGAFNVYRGAVSSFDMGWGILNPSNNFWTFGDSLYLIKLSDNSYRKLWIVSLKTGIWEFKYANVDGSNEQVITFNKSTYPNKNFVYFDIINNQLIDREPNSNSWDLTFVKHTDFVTPPGSYVSVTSVFSNKTIWSAKAHESDFAAASTSTTPQTAFTQRIDNIGREWKKFSSANGWEIYDSIAYFLYDADSSFYRIVFTGFGGMSNGKTYFTKELINSTVIDEVNMESRLALYPNPAKDQLTLLLNHNKSELLNIEIYTLSGKLVKEETVSVYEGIQQHNLRINDLEAGFYVITIKSDKFYLSQKFVKQ